MSAHFEAWIMLGATALLHFVWQGVVIAVVVAGLLRLLRQASAQSRYLLNCIALSFCLLLPINYLIQNAPAQASAQTISQTHIKDSSPVPANSVLQAGDPAEQMAVSHFAHQQWMALQPVLPYLAVMWAIGVAVLILRLLLGLRWVSQQVKSAKQFSDPIWQAKLQQMATAMGVKSVLRLGISTQLPFPVTAGWWRPIVILPASLLSGMPPHLVEALLAHEVAHIKRFDYLINLLQSLIEIVLFYHPVVWWLSKQIRQEREQIADDLAASLLGEPRRLALALSELEQFQFIQPQLAQGAHGGNLMLRIKRLIQTDATIKTAGWKLLLPSLGLGATCLALFAHANVLSPATPIASPHPVPAVAAEAIANTGSTTIASTTSSTSASTMVTTTSANTATNTSLTTSVAAMPPLVQSKSEKNMMQFALVKPDRSATTFVRSDRKGMAEIEKLKRENSQEFLWFVEKGQSYLIKDQAILDQANAAYKPMQDLGEQMEAQGKKMEAHGAVMERLGEQMQTLSDVQPGFDEKISAQFDAKMRAHEAKMAAFELKMQAAAAKVENAKDAQARQDALSALQKEQSKYQHLMQDFQKNAQVFQQQQQQLSQQYEKSLEPLKALEKQMADAAKPMEALGKQMDQMGKQMDKMSQQAEQQIWSLIQTAKQKGLVTPIKS